MTTYFDTSAIIKRYLDEVDSDLVDEYLRADPVVVSSWVTIVELRRNLARLLGGPDLIDALSQASLDLESFALISCDEAVATAAAAIGETLGVRSLDAIHLASAQRLHLKSLTFVTFDLRQAQAARSLGFNVLGV